MPTVTESLIPTDFSTLQAWWTARCEGGNVDLVGDDRLERALIESNLVDGDMTVDMDNAITDATRYAEITFAAGQRFDPATGLGARVTRTASTTATLFCRTPFTRMVGFGYFDGRNTGGSNSSPIVLSSLGGDNSLVDGVYIFQETTATHTGESGQIEVSADDCEVRNCTLDGDLALGLTGWANGIRVTGAATDTLLFNNNVHFARRAGIDDLGTTTVLENNIAMDCARQSQTDFSFLGAMSNCCSSDTSATGTGSIISQSSASIWEDLANADFTLGATSNAEDAGTPQSFSLDAAGVAHNSDASGWEMGPFDSGLQVTPVGSGAGLLVMGASGSAVTFPGLTLTQASADVLAQRLTDLLNENGAGPQVSVFAGATPIAVVPLNDPSYIDVVPGSNQSVMNVSPIPTDPSAVGAGAPDRWIFQDGGSEIIYEILGVDDLVGSPVSTGQEVRITGHTLTWPLT